MTRSLLALLLITSPALAHEGPGYFWNPVVTHTNGMRIASTTSLRSHNIYWQCDPGHVGYCDGQIQRPCRDAWRGTSSRYSPSPGAVSSRAHHTADGLEVGDSEMLGMLGARGPAGSVPAAPLGSNGSAPLANPLTPPTPLEVAPAQITNSEETWFDALQTIGRKIAAPRNQAN